MFQRLVSHNPDLDRLLTKGYAIAVDSTNHLIVRDIPYLDDQGDLKVGVFVTPIVLVDQNHMQQSDHQVFFAGGVPHALDGSPISNLSGGPLTISLSEANNDVVVERSFSNKPRSTGAFADFYEKIESYTAIISGPAMEKYNVTPHTFRAVQEIIPDTVFKFNDTMTSKAQIGDLANRFENDVVAVIGLGGTGAYLLDFLVRTRVKEIRGYDSDIFQIHNAYRAPGKTTPSEFGKAKADVLQARYNNFRTGLKLFKKFIDETSVEELEGVTFAFVCVDKGYSRKAICDLLIELGIPFIDVGMGLHRDKNTAALKGAVRTLHFPASRAQEILDKGIAELADVEDDIYRANIQIAELNAINAALAIMKFKQLRGFYADDLPAPLTLFYVNELKTYQDALNEN